MHLFPPIWFAADGNGADIAPLVTNRPGIRGGQTGGNGENL